MPVLNMFALFEDDLTIIHGTAGFAAFGSSTSGYGHSPPSATANNKVERGDACLRLLSFENVFILHLRKFKF